MTILGFSVGVVLVSAYVVIGSLVFTVGERVSERWFDDDGEPFTFLAGIFWPLVLPVAIVTLAGCWLVKAGAWLGRERAPRLARLPKAQVRK